MHCMFVFAPSISAIASYIWDCLEQVERGLAVLKGNGREEDSRGHHWTQKMGVMLSEKVYSSWRAMKSRGGRMAWSRGGRTVR